MEGYDDVAAAEEENGWMKGACRDESVRYASTFSILLLILEQGSSNGTCLRGQRPSELLLRSV